MPPHRFGENILDIKKGRFLDAVKRASDCLNVEPPEVIFWDTACPDDTGNEWAHIHVDQYKICVSNSKLKQMDYEDIEETATHEVTHLLKLDHSPTFYKRHASIKTAVWMPPAGVFTTKERKRKASKKEAKEKIDKKLCNYHLCRKESKLTKCPHCHGYFCSEHRKPYEPLTGGVGKTRAEARLLKLQKGGHPCTLFSEKKQGAATKQQKQYEAFLKKLLDKKPKGLSWETLPPPAPKKRRKTQNMWALIGALVLILSLAYVGGFFDSIQGNSEYKNVTITGYSERKCITPEIHIWSKPGPTGRASDKIKGCPTQNVKSIEEIVVNEEHYYHIVTADKDGWVVSDYVELKEQGSKLQEGVSKMREQGSKLQEEVSKIREQASKIQKEIFYVDECEQKVEDELYYIRLKATEDTEIKVVDTKTFTNYTEAVDYIKKWTTDVSILSYAKSTDASLSDIELLKEHMDGDYTVHIVVVRVESTLLIPDTPVLPMTSTTPLICNNESEFMPKSKKWIT